MSARTGLRKPVPLPVDLAKAFGAYVAASVASGVYSAEDWRLARKRDGSIWIAVTDLNGREHVTHRIAGSTVEALYVLKRELEALQTN